MPEDLEDTEDSVSSESSVSSKSSGSSPLSLQNVMYHPWDMSEVHEVDTEKQAHPIFQTSPPTYDTNRKFQA